MEKYLIIFFLIAYYAGRTQKIEPNSHQPFNSLTFGVVLYTCRFEKITFFPCLCANFLRRCECCINDYLLSCQISIEDNLRIR